MIIDAQMTDQPIDMDAIGGGVTPLVQTSGARVVFEGVVRNHDGGKSVEHLVYSAHPQAQEFLDRCVAGVCAGPGSSGAVDAGAGSVDTGAGGSVRAGSADSSNEGGAPETQATDESAGGLKRHGVDKVVVRHRVGKLSIGERALVVIVEAAHRHEAFSTCAAIVDAIKAQVPVWKEQFYSDGSSDWSNTP